MVVNVIFFLVAPQISPFDFGVTPINTEDVAMTYCLVPKGDVPIKITWFLNEIPVLNVVGVSVLNGRRSSQLSIDSVQAHHAGEYICEAINSAGVTSYAATLNVNSTCVFFNFIKFF